MENCGSCGRSKSDRHDLDDGLRQLFVRSYSL